MLVLIEEVLKGGARQGFPLTRSVSHMEWALEDRPGVDDLVEYEARLNYEQDSNPREMTVTLHEETASVSPFGQPGWRTGAGAVVRERSDPRAAFAVMDTPWDPLHRAYFNGYATWTYLTTPFCNSSGRRGENADKIASSSLPYR